MISKRKKQPIHDPNTTWVPNPNGPAIAGCSIAVLPWHKKFWRKLGYRFHLGEEPSDVDLLPGWMCTTTVFKFNWWDRILLLLTGKFRITITQHLDTVTPTVIKYRVDWQIIAPGNKLYD